MSQRHKTLQASKNKPTKIKTILVASSIHLTVKKLQCIYLKTISYIQKMFEVTPFHCLNVHFCVEFSLYGRDIDLFRMLADCKLLSHYSYS